MKNVKIILSILTVMLFASNVQARDQIRIVGSSTVYPYATVVAENFGKTGKFKTPVIESTGTGGGMKLFCAGVGTDHPDITNASRAIKSKEKALCEKNGVTEIIEIIVGNDGISFAHSVNSPDANFTKEQLWRALANEVDVDGNDNTINFTGQGYAGGYFKLNQVGNSRTFNIQQLSTLDNDWLQINSTGSNGTVCVIQNDGGTAVGC